MKASDECTWLHQLRYRAVGLRVWYGRRKLRLYVILFNPTAIIWGKWTSRENVRELLH